MTLIQASFVWVNFLTHLLQGGFGEVFKGVFWISTTSMPIQSFYVNVAVKVLLSSNTTHISQMEEKLKEFMHEAVIMRYPHCLFRFFLFNYF